METAAVVGEMPASEAACLFPDGWLAIVRLDPLRVDWRRNDGVWIRGSELPVPDVPLDARQKQWYLRSTGRDDTMLSGREDLVWPATIPPFRGTVIAASDGRVILQRSRDADANYTRYLVVNRRATLDGEISLAAGQRILGFGAAFVVIATTDADGLQHVSRHPWP